MLVHILDCVLDGEEGRGLVSSRALLVQLAEDLVQQGHTFMVVAGALAVPRLKNRRKCLCKHRYVSWDEKLRSGDPIPEGVQIDAKDMLCIRLDIIGMPHRDKQNSTVIRLEGVFLAADRGTAANAERKGTVLTGSNDAVLRRQM